MRSRSMPKTATSDAQLKKANELPADSHSPPRLMILHNKISSNANILTLPHPRTLSPTRYIICPHSGFFELQKLSTASSPYCSWLLQGSSREANDRADTDTNDPDSVVDSIGFTSKSADLYAATPLDPLFLMIPALEAQSSCNGDEAQNRFLCPEDLLEKLFGISDHFKTITNSTLLRILEQRLESICDIVEMDDMKLYRLNDTKLLDELLHKARKAVSQGLPASLEQQFVMRPLDKPVFAHSIVDAEQNGGEHGDTPEIHAEESTSSDLASATESKGCSQGSTDTSITAQSVEEDLQGFSTVKELQRLRVAFSFILSSYVPRTLAQFLENKLSSQEAGIDFKPLEMHLAEIARMKAEAFEARAVANLSRKRTLDYDEAAAERAAKRKKEEEDEKRRKANESRGVRDLKKVNVSGMKKMSDFFKKVPIK